MGVLIEKYIGKTGRKLFLLFCWLFTLLVIAAFADMVAGTFNAYTVKDGVSVLANAANTNGCAGTISIMFMVFAVIFGLIQKKFNLSGWKEAVVGILCGGFLCYRYAFPAHSLKGRMELYYICLYLLRGGASHVALKAAA